MFWWIVSRNCLFLLFLKTKDTCNILHHYLQFEKDSFILRSQEITSYPYPFFLVAIYQMMEKVLIICLSLFVQVNAAKMEIKCYKKDTQPVNLEAAFEDHCKDKEGNIFNEEAKLYSCCNCIM